MNLYYLPPDGLPVFPDPAHAGAEGLLAFGGRLRVNWLTNAYRHGIFPWYDENSPILWWSPDPRCVLFPEELHVPKSLRRQVNNPAWKISVDAAFAGVIRSCAKTPRPDQDGTWIQPEIVFAYEALHRAGYAHSLEVWRDGAMAGGMYGVTLGQVFFGESMFFRVSDASKVGFVWLVRLLKLWGYRLIDCQQVTHHLMRFGAATMARKEFLDRLDELVPQHPDSRAWRIPEGFHPLA